MTRQLKERLSIGGCLVIILVCFWWIYSTQVRSVQHNVALHRRIGEVLAEQTARLVSPKGQIVTIAIDTKQWPELQTQLSTFKAKLKSLGEYQIHEYLLDTKDQPKYGVGTGLSSRRFVRTIKKNPQADLFVSFIGAPKLDANDLADLRKKPKFIAESRSGDNLPGLFECGLIQVAVVSRFQFPAPGPDKPRTAEEWFEKRYQIVTPDTAPRQASSE
ncbi:MAG TPA: hypothetical protein VL361_30235 [Candidatus Limnocylindrales bacterium]|jgi:hypothetical protein|nr:hypothetical protein [Candidatus Limnocylindrales bacterium]